MRNIRQPAFRRRINPINKKYATSKERIEALQNDIDISESAKHALVFAQSLLDEAEEAVLDALLKQDEEIIVARRMEFLAANALNDKINKLIIDGDAKKATLSKLLNREE